MLKQAVRLSDFGPFDRHARYMVMEVAAWAAVVIHMAYLVYAVFGGFLAFLGLPWLGLHLLSSTWSFTVTLTTLNCPLTTLEKWLWVQAGVTPYDGTFIEQYLSGHVYPVGYDVHVWLGGATIAIASYVIVLGRRRAAQPAVVSSGQ
jgi:Protein of Unknown function (DUF2784)